VKRLAAVALLGALALAACQKAAPNPCADAEGGAPVGPALLAFLSRSRAAHHRADAFEERNDWRAAEAELAAVIGGPKPACPDADEVREVLADTHARLGDLESRHADFSAALASVERGLALVPEQSYFRGHLFEIRGLVEERQAKALGGRGDAAGAASAQERALAAFQEAMRIQSEVIEKAAPRP
jgi:tetratricopeptide (TPR) repeat protein